MRRPVVVRCTIVVALITLCEGVTRAGLIGRRTLVPPSEMVTRLAALMQGNEFWSDVAFTAGNILIAFVAAIVAGFCLGVLLHQLPRSRRALEPLIASYYALPFFVLYPLFIVLFGMNAIPIIFMGFLYAVMAMITGTLTGLDRIPRVFQKVGRTYQLDSFRSALLIQLPAASPYVFTGAKLAFGYAITGVIGSEFILSNEGLGYGIAYAYNNFDDTTMYALLVFVLTSVSFLTLVLHATEARIQHRARAGAADRTASRPTSSSRLLGSVLPCVVILLIWELLFLHVGREALASPLMSAQKILVLLGRPDFWTNVAETMTALALALTLSCIGGALIGIALAMNRQASEAVEPLLVAFYAMPKVTLYPVILLFFGIGMSAKVAFGALYGMIPMVIITLNAITNMNPSLRRTGRVLRLTPTQTIFRVILPATMPEVISGLRISFSITLLGVMIGEMFASQRGLGFMIMNSMGVNDTATMMAVTVFVGTFALLGNSALLRLDSRLHR